MAFGDLFKSFIALFTGKFPASKDVRAVCFGMGYSKTAGDCPGALLDSTRMHNLLEPWATAGAVMLNSQQATYAAAKVAMLEAVTHKLAIIFYSGHGGRDSKNNKNASGETDMRDEYLCFYDRMMRDDEVWQIVSQARGRVMLIFDCCHSGTMYRAVDISPAGERTPRPTMSAGSHPFTLRRFLVEPTASGSKPDMLVWSAAREHEYSYGGSGGGIFTNALLAAYRKNGTYDKTWNRIASNMKGEPNVPVRTKFGSGFDGKVFR